MPNRLIALSLSLLLCGAAVAGIAAAQPANPTLQAQPDRVLPRNPGRGINRPAPTPAEQAARRAGRCQEASARAAGRLAYLEARLNLTGAQVPAFTRWRDARLATARRLAETCAAAPQGRGGNAAPPSPVERLTREETRLQRRLADIQAERPALQALHDSLSPDQRQTLSRTAMAGRGGMMQGRGMMRRGRGNMTFQRGPGGNMMFRREAGPMGRGPGPNPPPQ